jgi:hypothetical protein
MGSDSEEELQAARRRRARENKRRVLTHFMDSLGFK